MLCFCRTHEQGLGHLSPHQPPVSFVCTHVVVNYGVHGAGKKREREKEGVGERALLDKLETVLVNVDATLLTSHQKLRLYKDAVCPRLMWDLSLVSFPISWVEKQLDTLVTRFLKRWTGLAKSADTSRLFLPKSKGGLQLLPISTIFKELQCARAASLMTSRDPLIHHFATQKTLAEAPAQKQAFKPYQQVVDVMKEDPRESRKVLVAKVK